MTLTIRNAVTQDADTLARIYNYYVLNTHITFDLDPVTPENRRKWLEQYNNNPLHRLLVAESEGEIVGYASSSSFRPKPAYYRSVETTIYLDESFAGKGFGKKLYSHLLNELAETEAKRCYGIIALPNEASVRLHQQLGFTEVGHLTEVGYKFEKFWDTLWMEKKL